MTMLMKTAVAFGLFLASMAVQAQAIDGKSKLICAFSQWVECSVGGCERVAPESVRGVRFLSVDLKNKQLASRDADDDRTAEVGNINDKDFQVALQGQEYALAWTMTIDKADGEMTFSGARENVIFNAFGYCTED